MKPYFTLFGREIPVYGVCFYLGIFIAAGVALLISPKKKVERYEIAYSGVYTMIGALIGSKLLFIAVSLKHIIQENIPWEAVIKGGFVFYGGLIGGILGLFIYCRTYKVPMAPLCEIMATVLPLGHAFGRVGCFFAGCCYGIPYDGVFSCTYKYTYGTTPLGVPLLPVQLIEAVSLLVIFVLMLTVYLKTKEKTGYAVAMYMGMYPVLRFILEFFRGDTERGGFLFLSTSQWVSLLLLIISITYFILKSKKNKQSKS